MLSTFDSETRPIRQTPSGATGSRWECWPPSFGALPKRYNRKHQATQKQIKLRRDVAKLAD